MASTSSLVIIAIIVGIVILGGFWAWSRNRVTGGRPPAKIEDKPASKPEPIAAPSPKPALPTPSPAAKPAPKPAATKTAPKPVAARASPKPKPPAAAKPAAKKAAAPKTVSPKAAPVAPKPAPGNLLLVKGLGPKLNTLLTGLGITRFDQVAAWSADDVAKVDEHLGAFKGRIERDSWIEQAGLLAKGAIADFEAKFGKLDSENR